ncbi:bacterioferritin-associated ferredoxin [Roseococcus sp. DSY-14]|uniref:(2Fe-2S)-binding protein n=1 Tax=Roseococcus sp. DSY-14 TaxID=3369650 RepID=UPI00387ABC15
MIVCLCNALTEGQVRGAVAGGASRPKDVYCACGKSAQCGCCTATILSIIREEPSRRAA